jgi:predicted dehydrogenase
MSKIRIGIAGAGRWGAVHAAVYHEHPDADIVGVYDVNRNAAESLAAKFGVDAVFSDLQSVLRQSRCDAVSVVTPDYLHADLIVACANEKRDVLVEKPLATTREDVQRIVDAVTRNRVRLMVDFHNRWSPPFAALKDAVDRGEIGDPYSAYYRLNDKKSVPKQMLTWAERSSVLWFLGSHSVDTLRWIFDDEIERVYSISRTGILKNDGVNVVDLYQTILEFRHGGIASMENGWITPDSHPCINDIKLNLLGTKGMFNLDLSNSQLIERYTETAADNPDVLVSHSVHGTQAGFAFASIRHFVDALVSGRDFLVSLDDAAKCACVLLAITDSAVARTPVQVSY